MNFLRALFIFFGGIATGIFYVGFIASLSFPYSEFPLIPVLISLAFVLRVRPTFFWFLLTIVSVIDLYRVAGFGVGIISLGILVFLIDRILRDLFSHRSFMGCVVISVLVGIVWNVCNEVLSAASSLINGHAMQIFSVGFFWAMCVQTILTAVIVGVLYAFVPRWWRERSPTLISGRGI